MIKSSIVNRPLRKLAEGDEVQGETTCRTGVYTPVHEDLSTGATKQSNDVISEDIPADFYQKLMGHFRGSTGKIKSQLEVYLPFIQELKRFYPESLLLDLGCGRGEWLELLQEHNFTAYGVDSDEQLAAMARQRGLDVLCTDGITHLKQLPDESFCVLSAFHLVEHLTFAELHVLVREAHRILVPGGILLMETPNPENILVGSSLFYLDPTHRRPIPPELLAFLPQYWGFSRIKIIRLQEKHALRQKEQLTLMDVFSGVSPDYGVIAQKNAITTIMEATQQPFAQQYGLRLDELAESYQQQIEDKLDRIVPIRKFLFKFTAKNKNRLKVWSSQLKLLKTLFKEKQFYISFRTYWRKAEIATAKYRHLLRQLGRRLFWVLTHSYYIKQNEKKSLFLLGAINASSQETAMQDIKEQQSLYSVANTSISMNPSALLGYLKRYVRDSVILKEAPQLFVDISELVKKDNATGIQRVVRSILIHWLINPPQGWRVQPVYANKYDGYVYAHHFTLKLLGSDKPFLNDIPITYRAGDIFFGLDLCYDIVIAQQSFYRKLREHEVKTCFLVHDLLPVLMPNYFPTSESRVYRHWLEVIVRSNGLFCVSQNTAQVLNEWIVNNKLNQTDRAHISWFHLGADLQNSVPSLGLPADAELLLKQLRQNMSFLLVATLEPRKSHKQALDAFELLWQQGHSLNLVFVGKIGWMMDSFVERIKSHPQYGIHLFWIDNASDQYVQKIYKAATCLLFPSEGEGFGLPIIEAANYGLPILARNLPVFREVAGEYAHYFSGYEASDLAEAINDWILLYQQGAVSDSSAMPRLTWKESATRLLASILMLSKDEFEHE
ncbi:glycosyltransferase [Legionella fallonii]|uniref:Putative methyltransferase n=1 Tax=Legionella fallonii LLAP-10 TaxID=1212491 RepID=A0A098GC33_9GAMM|nr:glycosyltransferase [Legionella fallonii]CEG59046.1 putative methyltransferase [Legionella fallonii LLAP-10]